jgi:hypothetical protein
MRVELLARLQGEGVMPTLVVGQLYLIANSKRTSAVGRTVRFARAF